MRSQSDQWTTSARSGAYAELFEGDDPLLSTEELRLLAGLDSELARRDGDELDDETEERVNASRWK